MAEYMITRSSIINRCNNDGALHFIFTEKEKPCEEAFLKDIRDIDGNKCSRYFVEINSIEEANAIGEKYNVDILITKNLDFENIIALVLYDAEIEHDISR